MEETVVEVAKRVEAVEVEAVRAVVMRVEGGRGAVAREGEVKELEVVARVEATVVMGVVAREAGLRAEVASVVVATVAAARTKAGEQAAAVRLAAAVVEVVRVVAATGKAVTVVEVAAMAAAAMVEAVVKAVARSVMARAVAARAAEPVVGAATAEETAVKAAKVGAVRASGLVHRKCLNLSAGSGTFDQDQHLSARGCYPEDVGLPGEAASRIPS